MGNQKSKTSNTLRRSKKQFDKEGDISVAVMGTKACGKSALIARVFQQIYLEAYNETVENMYRKKVSLSNGETVCLSLADVGHAEVSNKTKYLNRANGFLLCCTAEDINSWLYVGELFQEIKSLRSKDVPVVVALLKSDLSGPVTFDAIQTKCAQWNIPCFETSAFSNIQCEQPFSKLLELVLARISTANASAVFNNLASNIDTTASDRESSEEHFEEVDNVLEQQDNDVRVLRPSASSSSIAASMKENPRSLINCRQFGITTINLRALLNESPTRVSAIPIEPSSEYQRTPI